MLSHSGLCYLAGIATVRCSSGLAPYHTALITLRLHYHSKVVTSILVKLLYISFAPN